MGVSRRSYAVQLGVWEAAACRASASSRSTTLPGGEFDPKMTDAAWGSLTEPAKQLGLHRKQMHAETATGTIGATATKTVPQAAIRAVVDNHIS